MLEGTVATHRLSTNATVRQSALTQITKAASCLYNITYRRNEAVVDAPGKRWRSQWYFYYGGTTVNPTRYVSGGGSATTGGTGMVKEERQVNSTVVHVFGYAYEITNDVQYKQMGDEIFDASYGEQVDGIHNLADSLYHTKDYTMNYRSDATFLARRLKGEAVTKAVPNPSSDSSALIDVSLSTALSLSTAPSLEKADIKNLIDLTESDRTTILAERSRFVSADTVLKELQAALDNLRAALNIVGSTREAQEDAQLRIGWAAARLKRASDSLKKR